MYAWGIEPRMPDSVSGVLTATLYTTMDDDLVGVERNNLSTFSYVYLLRRVSPWPSCLRRWLGSLEHVRARGPGSMPTQAHTGTAYSANYMSIGVVNE